MSCRKDGGDPAQRQKVHGGALGTLGLLRCGMCQHVCLHEWGPQGTITL